MDASAHAYTEFVNSFKRELEKNVTIRNISKKEVAGRVHSIDFDINDDYSIGIWTNWLVYMNTVAVIVSLCKKYKFAGNAVNVVIGELWINHNPDEPFVFGESYSKPKDKFTNELWPKILSAVNNVIDEINIRYNDGGKE